MSRITKDLCVWVEGGRVVWPAWVPLVVLAPAIPAAAAALPAWALMWFIALGMGLGCKWLTWWEDGRDTTAGWKGHIGYLLGWPGMDARAFFNGAAPRRPAVSNYVFPALKICIGAGLVWGVARLVPTGHELWAGWVGLVGLVLILHFGAFELLAAIWQRAGVDARPIMRAPVLSVSVAEFWGQRWNVAFSVLVRRQVFLPLAREFGLGKAGMLTFLVSGLIHEMVISVPARAGYGLPTAYFLLQGLAMLVERHFGRTRFGLRGPWAGWIFTMLVTAGPCYWLFHPPFIRNVILPMLAAIGATGGPL